MIRGRQKLSRRCPFRIVIGHQIRVVRLLLVVNYHGLDIRKHILALSKASILHLAFLNA